MFGSVRLAVLAVTLQISKIGNNLNPKVYLLFQMAGARARGAIDCYPLTAITHTEHIMHADSSPVTLSLSLEQFVFP